jgi:hypothetical protein
MIFKQGSCEEELFEGMQNAQQEAIVAEDQQYERLILAAMEELNAAAECFEKAGRTARAAEVTTVMIALADSKKKTKPSGKKSEMIKMFKNFGFTPKDLGYASDEDAENEKECE